MSREIPKKVFSELYDDLAKCPYKVGGIFGNWVLLRLAIDCKTNAVMGVFVSNSPNLWIVIPIADFDGVDPLSHIGELGGDIPAMEDQWEDAMFEETFRHHSGDRYRRIGAAFDPITNELCAIYRPVGEMVIFSRPLEDFVEPRFVRE